MRIWKGYQHGINFGGWFSQKEHTEKHYQTFITEADFATVARWDWITSGFRWTMNW